MENKTNGIVQDIPQLTDPSKIQIDFQKVQKRIEAEIGAFIVQHCIKDVVIEMLTGELNQLKLDRYQRPESGQTDLGRHGAQGPDDKFTK